MSNFCANQILGLMPTDLSPPPPPPPPQPARSNVEIRTLLFNGLRNLDKLVHTIVTDSLSLKPFGADTPILIPVGADAPGFIPLGALVLFSEFCVLGDPTKLIQVWFIQE